MKKAVFQAASPRDGVGKILVRCRKKFQPPAGGREGHESDIQILARRGAHRKARILANELKSS
eukprot:456769-Prymnesium_polylepis.1